MLVIASRPSFGVLHCNTSSFFCQYIRSASNAESTAFKSEYLALTCFPVARGPTPSMNTTRVSSPGAMVNRLCNAPQ